MIDDAAGHRRNLDSLRKQIEKSQAALATLNAEIDKLRTLDESRPTNEQITRLRNEASELEAVWNDTVKAVKEAQIELERLKSAPAPGAAGTASASPADDEKIKVMQTQLDELLAKVEATRSANSDQFVASRKALDAALEGFQKQVTDAQGMMNGNPEIAAYLEAAQQLQAGTRKLTEGLIAKQEQQFGSLMELKARLNERMESRRVEMWQKDTKLQELTERQAVLQRKYNTAVGSGLQKDADDMKIELDLTRNMIKARQDLLPGDTFYADAIQQLQVIIDSTRKNIEEDRKNAEAGLATLQRGFATNQAVQRLPQEQKQLAEKLQEQLAQINAARRQYNQAIDAGAADSDVQLKNQIATLQAGIEARKKQLAEENVDKLKTQQDQQSRLADIQIRQTAIDRLVESETGAQKAFFAKQKDLRDMQARVAESRTNAETLDRKMRDKDQAERQLKSDVDGLEFKIRLANEAIEPVEPNPNRDISVTLGQDRRLLYILISSGGILLLFTAMVLWTLHTASLEAPVAVEAMAEPASLAEQVPAAPGNGHKHNGADEDQQPAII